MADRPIPVKNSTTSFWRGGELHTIDDYRSPDFPKTADVVIVGAGYAGASLAYHMLEKNKNDLSIVILEARETCSGATGRNGGHLKPDIVHRAASVLPVHGPRAAEEVSEYEVRHLKAVGDVIKREQIDCDYVLTRCIEVSLDEKGSGELKAKLESLENASVSVDDVFYCSEKTAEGFSGFKGARGAFSNTAGHLWPYKFITHLLAKAVKQGVNLQTNTPVSTVSSSTDSSSLWTVDTERGSISAKKVIFASNGYTSAILPEMKGKIVPVRGICSRIVCPSSPSPLLTNSYVIRFNDWEYDYLIPRTDGSIVVGGARRDFYHQLDSWFDVHDDSKLMESAKNYFDGYMQRHFHGWENSGAYTESVWTGIMGYTSDGFPMIGEVPGKPGQYVCAGFSGHGMPQVFLSAKAISDMVADGKAVEDVDLPLVYRLTRERLKSTEQHGSLKAYADFQKSTKP